MNIRDRLASAGFDRVIALDARDAGAADHGTLLLGLWTYQAEKQPAQRGAWIHPYYDASQEAYQAAKSAVEAAQEAGEPCALRNDIHVKPVFARMPGFTQGRNTLTYAPGCGSRFHVQIVLTEEVLPTDMQLERGPHLQHCGDCRRCIDVCPSHAIDGDGYHRERCLRNWMLSGQSVPEEFRAAMGNRLLGCDECQRCCPHNPPPEGDSTPAMPLYALLTDPKGMAMQLKNRIGSNMAIPNRVLAQACLLAGAQRDHALLPAIDRLRDHPSPLVSDHAAWAYGQLSSMEESP